MSGGISTEQPLGVRINCAVGLWLRLSSSWQTLGHGSTHFRSNRSMGMLVAFSSSTADIDSCSWNGKMMAARTGDTEKLSVALPTTSSNSTIPSAGANASFRGAFARWKACAWASAALRAQSAEPPLCSGTCDLYHFWPVSLHMHAGTQPQHHV